MNTRWATGACCVEFSLFVTALFSFLDSVESIILTLILWVIKVYNLEVSLVLLTMFSYLTPIKTLRRVFSVFKVSHCSLCKLLTTWSYLLVLFILWLLLLLTSLTTKIKTTTHWSIRWNAGFRFIGIFTLLLGHAMLHFDRSLSVGHALLFEFA
jgi:hypothetical protein